MAKATWVMASHPLIMAAREAGEGGEEIVAPIHLGDSLQLRYDNSQLIGQSYIELHTSEILDETGGEIVFQVPLNLARQVERFDNLMLNIAEAIDNGDDTDRILDQHGILEPDAREPLEVTIDSMSKLHQAGRNHVWAYYLRNMSRPAVISEQKVDAIIGNPPWLVFRESAGIIRSELEGLSRNQYQIWAGGRFSPYQDIATLFFCRAADLYLRPEGNIGMVLPHSALRSGHNLKWRGGYYEESRSSHPRRAISVDFSVKPPWDLSLLEPKGFFPMASCVAFASFTGGWGDVGTHRNSAKPLAPGKVEVWKGTTGSADVERVVTDLIHDDGTHRSPYASLSNNGVSIFDRRLFFVSAYQNDNRFALPNTRKTYPFIGSQDKKKYSVDQLSGMVVRDDNIFDVHLGETLAPYATLTPRTAVLPLSKATMEVPLDHSRCRLTETGEHQGGRKCFLDEQALDPNMRSRWAIMERLWDANKSKSDRKSLFERLNWFNSLISQLNYLSSAAPHAARIAYTGHGRPTASLITDSRAILDYTLFQVRCDSVAEAHYLLAIINSMALENAVVPFMPMGQFGARHLQKHLWKLPIPKYDPDSEMHLDLSRLGEAAGKSAQERISILRESIAAGSLTVTKARSELRHKWQKENSECKAIEQLVGELLLRD